jgi:site-specific DNA recombinase
MEDSKRKNVIYGRKSKYTGKGESVENQIDLCKQKLLSKFPEINPNEDILIFTDEGFTGANTNRP